MLASLNDTRYDSTAPMGSHYSPLAFFTLKVPLCFQPCVLSGSLSPTHEALAGELCIRGL